MLIRPTSYHESVREVDISVVDYNTQMHKPNSSSIKVHGVTSLDKLTERDFDFVIASAVLEHIPDAAATLRDLLSRVAVGGSLYARTLCKSFLARGGKTGKDLGRYVPGACP